MSEVVRESGRTSVTAGGKVVTHSGGGGRDIKR